MYRGSDMEPRYISREDLEERLQQEIPDLS